MMMEEAMAMSTPIPWPGTRSVSHTRRRIHYVQVMGEVLLNYFQRWPGYEMGRETPFPPDQRIVYLPRRRISLGGKRRGIIISPLLPK